jgi:hypothetical protein
MADLLVEAKDAVEAAIAASRDGLSSRELKLFRAPYKRILGKASRPCRSATSRARYTATPTTCSAASGTGATKCSGTGQTRP